MDISAWLRELGLERYEQAFRENEVGLDVLPKLTTEDLKEIGVIPVGDRRRLLEAIASLADDVSHSADSDPSTSASVEERRPAKGEAERRQLTVLFCDLVGSTELSARLDPEDMGQVIRGYQERCGDVVERWDGHIAKYMGDGVLAYFGWPQAHEDDAERAIRAGLALVDGVSKLRIPEGDALAVRIGIATGQVVVGELVGEGAALEEAVIGDAPNLAARLQGLAEPGAVVVAANTRHLVGGLFELVDLGPQRLKGFAGPLMAWRVGGESRAEGRFEALRGRRLTPLVGREHELAILLERWSRAREGDGQVVLLSGEPGIGKSRLMQALRERLAAEPYTPVSHFCSPYHTNSALYPVIRLLERAAGFTPEDRAEERLDRLNTLLAKSTDRLREAVPLVAALLSIPTGERHPPLDPSPERQKQRTFEVLADQLVGLAARQPVLAVYEDLHWIDPTTLELLDLVVERVRRLPILVLMTFRPEFNPPWAGQAHVTLLPLNRLGRRQAAAIVERLTGDKALPGEIFEQIVAKTEGVPLFVEELTKTVLESGLLTDAGDHYELTGVLPSLAVPATLHDSLVARLDRLGPIKEVAQIAAVIGREFAYDLLAAVAPLDEDHLRSALDQLVAAELLFRRGASRYGTYAFKHALVQEAAYGSLLRSRRQAFHGRVAKILDEQSRDIVATEPETIAHHYTEAGQFEPAILRWLEAGKIAIGRTALAEGIHHLTKALNFIQLLPEDSSSQRHEINIRIALGTAYMALKGWPASEVRETLRPARDLCHRLGENKLLVPVLWGLWQHTFRHGELARSLELAQEITVAAEATGQDEMILTAEMAAIGSNYWLGNIATAKKHQDEIVNRYHFERHLHLVNTYNHDPKVLALLYASHVLWMLGWPDRALEAGHQAVDLARKLGHPFNLCWALTGGSGALIYRREPEPLIRRANEAIDIARAQCMPVVENVRVPIWQSPALLELGQLEECVHQLRSGLQAWRQIGGNLLAPFCLGVLADALGRMGRVKEALGVIDEGVAEVEARGERCHEAELHRIKGELMFKQGRRLHREAEACFRKSITVALEQNTRSWELRAVTSFARLLADEGKRTEAHDLLEPIYNWFTEGLDTADLKDAKTLLNELS